MKLGEEDFEQMMEGREKKALAVPSLRLVVFYNCLKKTGKKKLFKYLPYNIKFVSKSDYLNKTLPLAPFVWTYFEFCCMSHLLEP